MSKNKNNKRNKILIIAFIIFVPICIVISLCSTITYSLSKCDQDIIFDHEVETKTIYNAKLKENLYIRTEFPDYEVVSDNYSGIYMKKELNIDGSMITVSIEQVPTNGNATDLFQNWCKNSWYKDNKSEFEIHEDTSGVPNAYCISYLKQHKSDPEGFCLPSNQYSSFAVFQKDNIVFKVSEISYSKTDLKKDQIIEDITERITK